MSQSEQPTNQQTQEDARLNKRLKDTPIAIVGMASLFANSRYLNQFWDLICDKINAITQVPENRWNVDDYYDADKTKADKSYCKRGGFIPEVDFNPMEFGLPPNILELTDSAQLLSLIVAKEVLQDARLPDDYNRDKIGITLGVGGGQKISQSLNARLQYPVLKKVFKSSGISDADSEMLIKKFQDQYIHWEENSFPGSLGNVIAGRIANRFDFGGINCVVDAACAGSLAAMRMAISELVEGRSEMMITGGVCTDNSPYMYMSFSKTPAFTTNETIQPFDIDSKGMMIGEGIGMVALKRLEDAERDGDRIYSVIKGVGASSDGKFKSIYAPRPEGQAKALKRAYYDAGFAPHTLGLIEAHGTGTAAGDVAEFNGLKSVFSEDCDKQQHIALGSVKSQIGHTKSTAGTAGLIKAALALHHKVLPPTINVSQPNPKLDIENSPFYLNTQTRPWLPRPDGTPRRAGISSFGFGGTNFHFVLEEYSQEHQRDNGNLSQYRQRTTPQNLLFSAENKAELISLLQQALATANTEQSLIEIASKYPIRTLKADAPRLGLTVTSKDELVALLEQALNRLESQPTDDHWSLPSGVHYRSAALTKDAKVAALFAGQGSQYLNMSCELTCHFPEARQQFVLADKVFAANGKTPLSQILYPIPVFNQQDKQAQEALLTNTANAQTAIGAVSMAQYQLFTAAGFNADMVAGHSFGELSALCAAGVISLEDYYQLTFARGHAMAQKLTDSQGNEADAGAMYAIITNKADDLTQLEQTLSQFEDVKVANYNSPTQLVIAGSTENCANAEKALNELGFKAINLPVSGAFHTPLVGHAQAPFAEAIDKIEFNQSKMPIYANATASRYDNEANSIKQAFKQHMLQSVRFSEQLEAMYADGARIFVEFGPKNILQKLLQNTLSDKLSELCCISLNPNPKGDSDLQLRQAAMQLAVAGIALENLDPYAAEITQKAEPSAMNIKLSATNHISAATKAKMEKSLNSGSISPQIQIQEKIVEVEKRVEIERPIAVQSVQTEKVENTVKNNSNLSQNQTGSNHTVSNDALSQFFAAQQQTAELHQQFLAIPQQYGETFSALMTAQAQMAVAGVAIPESLQRSMEQFHQHQAQTLASHSQFLELQAQTNANALNLLHGTAPVSTTVAQPQQQVITQQLMPIVAPVPKPVIPAVTAVSPAPMTIAHTTVEPQETQHNQLNQLNSDQVQQTMMAVVADKTGYPTEMLDLSMDMEADLGIDSIKRVEILGTVQDELPELPELSPEDLAECRTLGEIVTYMNSQLAPASIPVTEAVTEAATAPVNSHLSDQQVQQTVQQAVQQTMMSVVADKTGYPTEMLDLSMDMEADLGIDSIKRVEILGTVQDELPELPELSPEDLAECRTLGEIVTYMNSQLAPASMPVTEAVTETVTAPVNSQQVQQTVQQTMMSVVADKTGYPTEMLDLSMDMEADLGIDSIKRVEILGTVQDELPELPELSPEDLAECRTLGEIVSYMNSKLTASDSTPASANTHHMETKVEPISHEPLVELPPHSEVALKKLDAAKQITDCFAANAVLVIYDDGHNAGVLAEKLLSRKLKVVVVRQVKGASQSPLSSDIASVQLQGNSEVDIQKAIEQITAKHGEIHGFVHLQPTTNTTLEHGLHLDEKAFEHVSNAFLWAKLLQPSLCQSSETRRSFITVSRMDGAFGYEDSRCAELNQAALSGLTKTLSHEWPSVVCRALDIAPELNAVQIGQVIVTELFATANEPTEIGIKSSSANANHLERVALIADDSAIKTAKSELFITDKILVTGGAKGVTFECALALAKRCQSHFILAGRSTQLTADQFPLWAKDKPLEQLKAAAIKHIMASGEKPTPKQIDALVWPVQSSLEIDAALQAFEKVGASAEYISMDVSDENSVTNALSFIQQISPITGLIHGAGVLADKHIQDKTLTELNKVYGTKVAGLKMLLNVLDLNQLKLVALFSSAAGFYGNSGQSDYAMSNEILNKAALQLAKTQTHTKVMSFNWGPWDGGMVNPALKKMFTDRGVYVIPLLAGAELFANQLLNDTGVQLLIGSDMQGNSQSQTKSQEDKSLEAESIKVEEQVKKSNADGKQDAARPQTATRLSQVTLKRRITLESIPFVTDHRIGGHPVLPTVCAIQWMREAAFEQYGIHFDVRDYKLLKGIIFDSDKPQQLTLALTPEYDNDRLETVTALILGEDKPQYQGALIQSQANCQSEQFSAEFHHKSLIDKPAITDKAQLYSDGTLFHGPSLQGLDKVLNFDEQGLLVTCHLPQLETQECGEFYPTLELGGCQPFAEDLLLQAMLVWARMTYGAASLPSSMAEFISYKPMQFGQRGFIELKVIKTNSRSLVADVALYHENGELSAIMRSAKVTISKNLNSAFIPATQADSESYH